MILTPVLHPSPLHAKDGPFVVWDFGVMFGHVASEPGKGVREKFALIV